MEEQGKWKRITEWSGFPFLVLGIVFFIFHLMLPHINDDLVIEEGMEFTSITPHYIFYLIVSKYQEWSSRIFINVMTLIMGKLPHILWVLADTGMVVLAAVSIKALAGSEKSRQDSWFIISLIFLYPFVHMSTAGWKATTITYFWSLSLGLFAMIPIRKWMDQKTIHWYEYFLYSGALLYGANQEQMSAVLTGIYGLFLIYGFFHREKRTKQYVYLWFQTFLALAGFFSALMAPGNMQRSIEETVDWFSDYSRLSLLNRLEMGISSAGYQLFFRSNWCFLVLTAMTCYLVWKKYKEPFYRGISALPVGCILITGPCMGFLSQGISGIEELRMSLSNYGTITVQNYTEASSYVPIILIGILCISFILSLYLICGNTWESLLLISLFLIGYASRVVLGFSPTVWASNLRTYLYLYFVIIGMAVLLYQKVPKSRLRDQILGIGAVIVFLFGLI